jgi:flavodoxin I
MVDVKDDWDRFFPELDKVDFSAKKVAIVGLGDHIKYPAHFVTSMAILAEKLMERGAKIIGAVSTEDYTFDESDAVNKDGMFHGLAIDEDNEDDLTAGRLQNWVAAIKSDFDF